MSDVKSIKINNDARDVKDVFVRELIGNVSELHTSDKTTLVDAINEVFDNDSDDDGKIGDMSNLMTSSKSNLVGAVNEVYQSADNANDAIGDLSNLSTQNKGNIVGAINEVVNDIGDTNDGVTALTNRMTTAEGDIDNIEGDIGDLSGLHTTDKNSLVGAINETLDSVGDIGDVNLPDLTNIQNTVDAINGVIAQTNNDLTTLTNRVQSDELDIVHNTSDIGSLETAVGDIEDVTDMGYTDLSDAVKQIHDDAQIITSDISAIDNRLGTSGNLSEPYADQIAANMNHIGDLNNLDINGRDLVDVCNYMGEMIGTLSNLSTTVKTSLVAAINEVAQSGGGSGGSGGSGVVASYTADSNDTYTTAFNKLFQALTDTTFGDSFYILTRSNSNTGNDNVAVLDGTVDGSLIRFKEVLTSGTGNTTVVSCDVFNVSVSGSSYINYSANPRNYTDYSQYPTGVCTFKIIKIGSGSGSGGKTEVASVTADGSTNFKGLLQSLFTSTTFDKTKDYVLTVTSLNDTSTFRLSYLNNDLSEIYFTDVYASNFTSGSVVCDLICLKNNDCSWKTRDVEASTATIHNTVTPTIDSYILKIYEM